MLASVISYLIEISDYWHTWTYYNNYYDLILLPPDYKKTVYYSLKSDENSKSTDVLQSYDHTYISHDDEANNIGNLITFQK